MEADKVLEAEYKVGPEMNSLSVVVGNAQFGAIDVRFTGATQPLARQDNTLQVNLGRGEEIAGRTLVVRTLAADVNPFTNKMIVTHVLSGGPNNQVFPIEHEVGQEGDVAYVKAIFHLVA